MNYFVYRVQMPCTECGEAVILDGPRLSVKCGVCQSQLDLEASIWRNVLFFRTFAQEMGITEGRTRGSSLTSGEIRVLVRWGPQAPLCSSCNAPLAADSVAQGSSGALQCACGSSTSTFPVPSWLTAVEPNALQLFGTTPEDVSGSPEPAPEVQQVARPVMFICPQCGASLRVGSDTARILTCSYCDTDVYLPDPLWRSLHPVRKRSSWWVRFKT